MGVGQMQVWAPNSGPHLSGHWQLLLAVPGKFTKLHLVKQLIQAQVSNSGPCLSGRWQLLLAMPGKFTPNYI